MESRRSAGGGYSVREAVGLVVPLCTHLAELHRSGKRFYVHPSALRYANDGTLEVIEAIAHTPPTNPRDRACLAPEEKRGTEGDARGSVFAIGAILYELLTGAVVGPGMRRPAELVDGLPSQLETVLGKALVADPKHRPADLGALAQALHHVAPASSIAPPDADESHLDHDSDFDVDVSLSMIPPPPKLEGPAVPKAPGVPKFDDVASPMAGIDPLRAPVAIARPAAAPANDPTRRLASMKAALESDPRPRYVVVKDGMDHGPFSAVELLQQIATGSFQEHHALRDVFSNDERFIKEWEEFRPFAEQAKLNREIVHEKKALEAVVAKEKQGAQYKTLVGVALLGVVLAGALGFWLRNRKNKDIEREIAGQQADVVEVDGGLAPGKTAGGVGGPFPGGGGPAPGGGSYPMLGGGMSCQGAQAKYVEEYKIGGNNGPPDLTAGAYGAVLNRGAYLNSCGVPPSTEVNICAAVQNGRAVGVTVTTNPSNPGVNSCVAQQVRALGFPAHPRLDVTHTTFAAQ